MAGKQFWGNMPVDSADILRIKNFIEIALSHTVSEIMYFMQKFKMATKNGGKMIFGNTCQKTLQIPEVAGQKFRRNHSISHRF